ncbi:tol-pal system YbgF family protein [Flavobacterium qiangtangense]|uniref:Tol-pal system YbgF family protein n=1 Tax=Flavobacterium qiangtangense TaxID=1442595 RepID=A0ABW1PIV1_9FLAO
MGIFSGIFKKKEGLAVNSGQLSMEDIEKIQLSLKDNMDAATYNSVFNQACRLIPKKQYNEAIALFSAIAENSTDTVEKGSCESQIGVCHFFLGDYEKALEFYIKSYNTGYDEEMADFNIWEVCEKLMKADGDNARWSQQYLNIFPNGKCAAKAKKNI